MDITTYRYCTKEGCLHDLYAKGLCRSHYNTSRVALRKAVVGKGCSKPGCKRKHRALGLCTFHYQKLKAKRRKQTRKEKALPLTARIWKAVKSFAETRLTKMGVKS